MQCRLVAECQPVLGSCCRQRHGSAPSAGRGAVTSALPAGQGTFSTGSPKLVPGQHAICSEPRVPQPWGTGRAGAGTDTGQLRMTGVQAKPHSYKFEYLH